MPDAVPLDAEAILTTCLVLVAAGLATTIALVTSARRAIGNPIASEKPGRRNRRLVLIGAQAIVLSIVAARGELPLPLVAACLCTCAAIAWLAPGFKDATCGETGVQRGWYARRFEHLEEWRMTGDHLRFRLFGLWTAVPLPLQEQPKIREKLLQLNAARESRFKD